MNGWHSLCLQLREWLTEKKVLLKLHSARVGRIQVHERELCLRIFFFNIRIVQMLQQLFLQMVVPSYLGDLN